MEAYLKPMLCQDGGEVANLPTGTAWVYERKLDGWRALFHVEGGKVKLYARSGKTYTGKLPYIEGVLARLPDDTVIDGELVATNGWGSVQSVMGSNGEHDLAKSDPLKFVAFDVTRVKGTDVRSLDWSDRRALLEQANLNGPLVRTAQAMDADPDLHDLFLSEGAEGTVAKRRDSKYVVGRSPFWIKFKPTDTIEVEVEGMIEGTGALAGHMGALECRVLKSQTKVKVGTGFDQPARLNIFRSWLAGVDSWKGKTIEIRYQGTGPTGVPRFPRFERVRDDLGHGTATPPKPKPRAPRASGNGGVKPRNYRQMGEVKLRGCLADFDRGHGAAIDEANAKGRDLSTEEALCRAAAAEKGYS